MTPTELYLTRIEIWTDYDPTGVELVDLAREATSGDGFCSLQSHELVADPAKFPNTEFFDLPDDESTLTPTTE